MSQLTVGNQPQPLFLDGLNESVILTNKGPFTIYLDSNSSISTSSYPLPATASIVWDAMRPLWVMAGGDSSVLAYTLNGNVSNVERAATTDLLRSVVNTNQTDALGRFECSSYQTVILEFQSTLVWTTTAGPDAGVYHEVLVQWYDANGRALNMQRYMCPSLVPNSGIGAAQLTLQARGDFCEITIDASAALTYSAQVYGTTRYRRNRFDWIFSAGSIGSAAYVDLADVAALDLTDGYASATTWVTRTASPVFVNQIGHEVTLSLHVTTSVTAAGLLRLRDFLTKASLEDIVIPVVTGPQVIKRDMRIPVSRSVELAMVTDPTTAGNVNISLTWKDHNSND